VTEVILYILSSWFAIGFICRFLMNMYLDMDLMWYWALFGYILVIYLFIEFVEQKL